MAKRTVSHSLHPEVQEVPCLRDHQCMYVASEREHAAFQTAILGHREFVVGAATAFGFDDAELTVVSEPSRATARFVGHKAGRRFVFSEGRSVHPEYGLRVDDVVCPIVDLLVKIRGAQSLDFDAPPLKLFWIADPLHEDDWFVVARTARDARRFYAYDCGDDQRNSNVCTRVATLPFQMQKVDDEVFNVSDEHAAGWPSHETIRACGGIFDREDQPRVVNLKGETFREGGLDALVELAHRTPRLPRSRR